MITPETRIPSHSDILPRFTPNDLAELAANGVAGLGVIAFIFDHRGRVLMLDHAAGTDRSEPLLGPVSEKSKYYARVTESGIVCPTAVESAVTTLRRGLEEELGIGNLALDFEMLDPAYAMSERQLHDDDPLKRKARAVVAVMRTMNPGILTARHLPRSGEILSADFYNFNDLLGMSETAFRPGTADFLWEIATNNLYEPFRNGADVGHRGTIYRLGSHALNANGLVAFDVDFTEEVV